MMQWGSLHTHSIYSPLDAMAKVGRLVEKAEFFNQPFLGLTDHGNMAGTIDLYKGCKKAGILPYPGIECYLIDPNADDQMDTKNKRYHLGLLARNLRGYQGLVRLSRVMHSRPNFSRFPRLTLNDLMMFGKEYGKDVLLTTGCFFGLVQQKISEGDLRAAKRTLTMYASCFPNTIVEIQNHHIQHSDYLDDRLIVSTLTKMAVLLGLPVIATQDSHYADRRNKPAHELMKRMVYGGVDDAFPGDSFHFASGDWVAEHYDAKTWSQVMEGVEFAARINKLSIPPLDEFKTYMPAMSHQPQLDLSRKCWKSLTKFLSATGIKVGSAREKKYYARLKEELSIIDDIGMANYFLLVLKVVEWCNQKKICVEARGSANGSLVCFMLGITQVDPVKWGLLVERFISRDRIKPPDIDLDIEDDRRGELLEYLKTQFPTTQIGTWAVLGASNDDPTRGSILVTFKSYLRRREELAALETSRTQGEGYAIGRANFQRKYGHIESIEQLKRVDKDDYRALRQIADMKPYKSYGVHAAGVLLGSADLPIEDYVPVMLVASSNTTVSQYDMDAVEQLGLLKLDVLGQATLSVMKRCQEMIGRENPNDFTWIPEDDPSACKILREGRPDNGIFHFEGYALANGSPVLTPTGWKPIESLTLGDAVIDPDGGTAKIEGVYPQGRKQMYTVTLIDGSSVEASEDHLWNAYYNSDPVRTYTTAQLKRFIDETTIAPKLVDFVPSDLGEGQPLPIDPYTLGALLGDGCLTNESVVRISSADKDLVDRIVNAYPGVQARKDNGYGWWFTSRDNPALIEALRAENLMGLPAHAKSVPNAFKWTTAASRLELLRGLMDTDGCVTGQGRGRFVSTSIQLAEDVRWLVYSLGGRAGQVTASDRGTMTIVGRESSTRTIYTVDSIRFHNGINPFWLDRKASRVRTPVKRTGNAVVSIVKSSVMEATCIAVGSASECFITKDWIVTHNTKAKGGREMGIRTTKDAVLASALYMPGSMDTGQTELFIKHRRDRSLKASYLHPIYEAALSETYGAVVFQEQPIQILRALGMSIADINMMFKIVKDSGAGAVERNADRLATLKNEFDRLAAIAGITDLEHAWYLVTGFIAYGFNKAHATGYGIRSYRCAYLKAHYPLEFMSALLVVHGGKTKEDIYAREARRIDIRLLPPDVNVSSDTWTIDRKARGIRKGLSSIKGIGPAAAQAIANGAPYVSIDDLIERIPARSVSGGAVYQKTGQITGKLLDLSNAGALSSLGIRR